MYLKKCRKYFSEISKKSGLIISAFSAVALFAVLFCIRLVNLFDKVKSLSTAGFWVLIVGALIGFVLTIVYLVTKLKSKELGAQDTLLLTLDFLMVYLLFGTIIFKFLSLETVYYAVALVIVIVLTVLRIQFADIELTAQTVTPAPNIGVKKYFDTVIGKFGLWPIILMAFLVLGALLLFNTLNLPALFISQAKYTIGILIVGVIAFVVYILCVSKRINSRIIDVLDAFTVFAFFASIFAIIPMIMSFTPLKLAIWLVALIVCITFIKILASNTYVAEEVTDDAYFVTDANSKFVKGPKVYFKQFFAKFNLFVLGAVSLIVFALLSALVSVNFLGWASKHNFMLYCVLAILLVGILGIIYLAKTVKKRTIGLQDALLCVLDISLLLLVIPLFVDFGSDKIASLVLWIIFFVIVIAFTITRLFMVKEPAPVSDETGSEETNSENQDQKVEEIVGESQDQKVEEINGESQDKAKKDEE